MDPHQALVEVKTHLATLYDDVKQLGSGRGEVVNIANGLRRANISLSDDDTSWFVELWSANDPTTGEEDLVDERDVRPLQAAIERLCTWLDGGDDATASKRHNSP